MADEKADLVGPGIGNYEDLEKILPQDYSSLLTPKETMEALYAVKRSMEEGLCRELNLLMVQVPLIVDTTSGVNNYLDRDGSRTPIQFHISNDYWKNPIDAEVVQAATKWKRMALKQFGMEVGEGLITDMRAVRKDYFLDHDHSAYVDQWDWELVVTEEQRNLKFLTEVVQKTWKVLKGADPCVGALSAAEDEEVSGPSGEADVPPRRGDTGQIPRSPEKAARDGRPAGVPRDLHLRDRVDAQGRLPARDEGRPLQ